MRRKLATLGALALFGALLWYGAQAETQVECDLCLVFKGQEECRTGRGESEQVAIRSAVTAACAVMGSGVNDAFRCDATPPKSLRCRQL